MQIDLGVIAVANARVSDAIADSLKAGAGAICVITAGFKEVGPRRGGAGAEDRRHVSRQRARLLGPELPGPDQHAPPDERLLRQADAAAGGISVISQSGALCTAILDLAATATSACSSSSASATRPT